MGNSSAKKDKGQDDDPSGAAGSASGVGYDGTPPPTNGVDPAGAVSQPAEQLVCPLTMLLFEDPVICTTSGESFERDAIEEWLQLHAWNPVTRCPLAISQLQPNTRLRGYIDQYRHDNGLEPAPPTQPIRARAPLAPATPPRPPPGHYTGPAYAPGGGSHTGYTPPGGVQHQPQHSPPMAGAYPPHHQQYQPQHQHQQHQPPPQGYPQHQHHPHQHQYQPPHQHGAQPGYPGQPTPYQPAPQQPAHRAPSQPYHQQQYGQPYPQQLPQAGYGQPQQQPYQQAAGYTPPHAGGQPQYQNHPPPAQRPSP